MLERLALEAKRWRSEVLSATLMQRLQNGEVHQRMQEDFALGGLHAVEYHIG